MSRRDDGFMVFSSGNVPKAVVPINASWVSVECKTGNHMRCPGYVITRADMCVCGCHKGKRRVR